MYVLVLIGYVVVGAGHSAGPSVASPLIVGHFDSAKSCFDTIGEFERTKAAKDNDLREYRWSLLCIPAGADTKN